MPDYGLFDFGVIYNFPIVNFDATIIGRINNAFDSEYISDASDGQDHDAASSFVYYGFGRTWSLGLTLRF
jgi:outer membrane receptor protein involved in Fe transport